MIEDYPGPTADEGDKKSTGPDHPETSTQPARPDGIKSDKDDVEQPPEERE